DREAFGAKLLDSPALRFRLAEMETELEAARALLWRAGAALDPGAPRATRLCAMAHRQATGNGLSVAVLAPHFPCAQRSPTERSLQLHGGYGYLTEYGIEKIVRDLRVHRILEGTNEIMNLIVARGLTGAA